MYRVRSCLTKRSLKNLYYSYRYPYLIYCIEIWEISPQTHLKIQASSFNYYFFYKIYSLCKNIAISKVLNKLQIFHFRSTVHTNTTPTVTTHSCVLQKPPSCNDNGYKFEFKILDQIGTSVRFWPKKVKC